MTRRNANARHVHDQALAHMLTQYVIFWMGFDDALRQLLRNGRSCLGILVLAHLADFRRSEISFQSE